MTVEPGVERAITSALRLEDAEAGAAEVLVLVASIRDAGFVRAMTGLRGYLSHEERIRQSAYRCLRSGAENLLGLTLARFAVASRSGVAPEQVRFSRSSRGKPHVAGPGGAQGIHFNVSHSDGLVVCAIGLCGAIGVDVETRSRCFDPTLAMRFFSAGERAQLAAMASELQPGWALRQWTLKEAYLKASGAGLSKDLASFSVVASGGSLTVQDDEDPNAAARWRFHALETADALCAVAAARNARSTGTVAVRHVSLTG